MEGMCRRLRRDYCFDWGLCHLSLAPSFQKPHSSYCAPYDPQPPPLSFSNSEVAFLSNLRNASTFQTPRTLNPQQSTRLLHIRHQTRCSSPVNNRLVFLLLIQQTVQSMFYAGTYKGCPLLSTIRIAGRCCCCCKRNPSSFRAHA